MKDALLAPSIYPSISGEETCDKILEGTETNILIQWRTIQNGGGGEGVLTTNGNGGNQLDHWGKC